MRMTKLLIGAVALAFALPAAAQDCDRACLIDMADDYAAALVAHDPSKVPLASSVVTVENVKKIGAGEGLWRTATGGPTEYRIHVADPVSQQVGLLAMMEVEGKPTLVGIRLKREGGMGLVMITHDMGVVAEMADRVIVQYAGQPVEARETQALFADPRHPYTAALLAALPERAVPHEGNARRLPALPGMVPGPFDRPPACVFEPRCAFATDHCRSVAPALAGARWQAVRCHTPLQGGVPQPRMKDAA